MQSAPVVNSKSSALTAPHLSTVRKDEVKQKSKDKKTLKKAPLGRTSRFNNDQLLEMCRTHLKAMTLVDSPEVKLLETKGPTPLNWDSRSAPRYLEYLATPQSLPLRSVIRSMFRDRIYNFRLSTALNMSSSGTGIVNSTISMDVVRSSTDFSAISAIFQEFFVTRADAHWYPDSRYQYPTTGTSTLSIANRPIGCAQLQHFAAAYSSLSALSNNYDAKFHSTGDPFVYSWVNVEKSSQGQLPVTSVTQAWCDTVGSQTYGGSLQFLSQAAPPALPISQVLGTFMVHFDLLFRVRE